MAERRQCADAMKLAERGPPRLEERLGSDHQDAHGRVIFARNRNTLTHYRRRLSLLFIAFKFAVSAVLLWILFSRIDGEKLWTSTRPASIPWLIISVAIYAITIAAGVWRWRVLLEAQHVHIRTGHLTRSYLVGLFFNNFLPSNIGGDVIRIRDTAPTAGSKTLATAVVVVDRGLGLMALILIAACGASVAARAGGAALPILPVWLWIGFLLAAGLAAPAVLAPAGFGKMLQPL